MGNMIKQLRHQTTKNSKPLILLGLFSLLIWFAGPLVAISNYAPLADPSKRYYAIAFALLAWILIRNLGQAKKDSKPDFRLPPELAKKTHILDVRFQQALHFLKKTFLLQQGKDVKLVNLPWYMLIGAPSAGKTTLLTNANVPFVLARKFQESHFQLSLPSDTCDWWVTHDMVLVDVPSAYTHPHSTPSKPHFLWQRFLSLLQNHRGKNALHGILLTLPLPELLNEPSHDAELLLATLKQRCIEIRDQFGKQIHFHLIITKCDLVPGFMEFFNDSGSDELAQAWGLNLPTYNDEASLVEAVIYRFNVLIKRINKQLIWRLHQERNPALRHAIKDFPLELERLKDSVISTLKQLEMPANEFILKGIYLTSGRQFPIETPSGQNIIDAVTSLSTTQLSCYSNTSQSKSYFIRQLLQRALITYPDGPLKRLAIQWKNHPYVLTSFFGTLILFSVAFGNQWRQHIQITHAINAGFAQYQEATKQLSWENTHLTHALPLFQALQNAMHNTERSFLANADHRQAVHAYHQALQKIVLPEIKRNVEAYLTSNNAKNPLGAYTALKAYLMLGDKTHYQPEVVFSALQATTPDLFNADQQTAAVTQLIESALTEAWEPLPVSPELVTRARKQILNRVPAEIGYVILKSYPDNALDNTVRMQRADTLSVAFASQQTTDQLPKLFSGSAFADIYSHQIPQAVDELVARNWILGTGNLSVDKTALIEQIRRLYITNYIDSWEARLANISLPPSATLSDADQRIVNFTGKDSPFIQMIQTIKDNTNFAPLLAASPKLAEINQMLNATNEPNAELYKILIGLNQLHATLQTVLNANDPSAAAFQIAQAHAHNVSASMDALSQLFGVAEGNPTPIKNWLTNITTDSWHNILQQAAIYIDKHWQTDITPIYTTQIANRFPFTAQAEQEVSLEQFSKFLGTQGVLASFFRTYLEAFSDNSTKTWAWKKIHNEALPFPEATLAQIQHAAHLQRAFFPDGSNLPLIHFTLQPIALDPTTKSFQLNIEGQLLQYTRSQPILAQVMTWPSSKDIHATILNVLADNDVALNDNSNSEWGWFRLVSKSTQQVINSKELILTFDMKGHKAAVMLHSQGRVNPFLSANLTDFMLPAKLLN